MTPAVDATDHEEEVIKKLEWIFPIAWLNSTASNGKLLTRWKAIFVRARSVRLHSQPIPSSDLEIKRYPNGGMVTGIYFPTRPPVYTAFNESAGDGW